MLHKSALLAVFFAAACGQRGAPVSTPASTRADSLDTFEFVQQPPVHALLGFRSRLQLSSAQVAALDSIGQQLNTENGPTLEEMRRTAAESGTGRFARRPRQLNDEDRAALRKVRDNNRRAVAAVRTLLTAEQQRITCELFDQQSTGTSARTRTNRQRGMQGMPLRSRRTWPWCDAAGTTRTP